LLFGLLDWTFCWLQLQDLKYHLAAVLGALILLIGLGRRRLGLDAVAMLLQWLAVFRQILMGMAP
jgi:hypothetical protein